MAKAATSLELKVAFETHLKETEGQITRLKQVKVVAIANILEQTLAEEEATDKALSELAEGTIHLEAK